MAPTTGAGKRWVPCKLRHVHEVPSRALNWRLLLAVLSMGLLGASRGMDEGVIAGSIGTPAFEHAFNAPRQIRGLCTSVYSVSIYLGAMLGYAVNLGASRSQDKRKNIVWQIVVVLPMVWHAALLLSTFFIHESPRWLLDRGHVEKAARSLTFYRNLDETHPAMLEETQLMRDSIASEHRRHAETLAALPTHSLQRRSKTLLELNLILTSRKNLLKVALGVMIQLLVQFGGPGAIATYANRIMTLVGASDSNGYVMSVGFGATKLGCGILSSLLLIDLLGRRKTLLVGVAIQGLSMLYVSVFLGLYVQGHRTTGEKHAGQAALAAIFISGASFSAGGSLAQYLVGTEIFEMHVRSLASSLVMAMHYLLQFSATRALQPMLNSPLGGAGTFAFYAAVSLVLALPFYAVFLPETAGLPLEEIDQVFERPVWAMRRATRARQISLSSAEQGGENKTATLPKLDLQSSAASSTGMDDDDKKEDLASQLRVQTSL